MSAYFLTALSDICMAHEAMRPPNRVPVSRGAADNLFLKVPGKSATPWSAIETPYMVEPMDMLASRNVEGVVFVGPAQSGKTAALGEGWLAHNVVNDPGDMLIVQMTQDKAREYSKQRIDRAIKASPNLWALRGPSASDDNLHDKQFKHGMWLKIAWPTVSNMSSTSYRYVFLTDYDRMPDDIEGEGDPWGLGAARPRTFGRRGKICAESSPGRPVKDPNWKPATPHEAPPCGGILGIYNRSDRRRLYWPCPHCGEWFEPKPGVGLFRLPPDEQLLQDIRGIDIDKMARQFSRATCPVSGCGVDFEHRRLMNRRAVWLPDGLRLDAAGKRHGEALTSSIAGYWLGGAAAAYSTWESLIRKHLQGMLEFANTGEETAWQTTVNTDQGAPYMKRALVEAKRDVGPADRKERDLERYVVPAAARCLLASVDVQAGLNPRFIVHVEAVGEHGERWPVDRYPITKSLRRGEGGDELPIEPAVYPEDWDVLTERVLRATYRIEGSDLEARVHLMAVDTGGDQRKGKKKDEGVANLAYAYWRRLRRERLHNRVRLVKGVGTVADWTYRETEAGGGSGSGDVPLWLLNTNLLKDAVDGALGRTEPGPGFVHIPGWWSANVLEELQAEVRNADGTWTQVRPRNETLDLMVYVRALMAMEGMDKRAFWQAPKPWARPLELGHPDVVTRDERREMQSNERIAPTPAPEEKPAPRPLRRTGRSSYL